MTDEKILLKVTCPPPLADLIAMILLEAGSAGVEERDATTLSAAADAMTEIIAGFDTPEMRTAAEAAVKDAPIDTSSIHIEPISIGNDDWRTKWREFFAPQVFDELQVITPWMSPPHPNKLSIVIDPGQAFGTGGHATTKLLIQMLEQRAAAGTLPSSAVDIGAGSGILSIAARKLGVSSVQGVDVEEEAIVAFYENAERNGVREGLDCILGSASDLHDTWPLVLANIQIDVFRLIASDIIQLVAPFGEVLVSGILTEQADECISLWPGFSVTERADDGEWVALALARNP